MQKNFAWNKTLMVVTSVFLVAFIGSMLADVGPWYDQLPKIALQPPKWIFGPAWTIIFILIGIAALLIWNEPKTNKETQQVALFSFGVNGILNILWSFLFFTLKNIPKASIEILVLWISIVVMMLLSAKINKKAAWLLAPYLLWVSFATYLTWSLWVAS